MSHYFCYSSVLGGGNSKIQKRYVGMLTLKNEDRELKFRHFFLWLTTWFWYGTEKNCGFIWHSLTYVRSQKLTNYSSSKLWHDRMITTAQKSNLLLKIKNTHAQHQMQWQLRSNNKTTVTFINAYSVAPLVFCSFHAAFCCNFNNFILWHLLPQLLQS